MKLPVFEPAPGTVRRLLGAGTAFLALVCLTAGSFAAEDTPAPVSPAASPAASAKPHKGTSKPPKANAPVSREIPLVLPIGESADIVSIPRFDGAGQILSQLMTVKMTRIDATHLQMQGTKLDLNKADGKSDYHIEIPTSTLDTKTNIITSDAPVVISTAEFELTGERMKFNTVERSGELMGKVRMRVHNLKQTAGAAPQQTPKSE